MKMFFVILMSFAMASAEVVFNGACPALQPVRNFDMSAYSGNWYHVKKVPLYKEGVGNCATASFVLEGDSLKLNFSRVVRGIKVYVSGAARRAEDAYNSGKLILDIDIEDKTRVEPLNILDTDYNNYSISYSCKYDEITGQHGLNLWVLSRNKELRGEAKARVDASLRKYFSNIDPSEYVTADSSDRACWYYTTRVYRSFEGY